MSSPYINHFTQPDSLIPDPSNPQAWNRYSYVMNRPVNFNDPTGHMADDDSDGGGSLEDTLKGFKKYGKHKGTFNDYYATVHFAEEALANSLSGGITQGELNLLSAYDDAIKTERARVLNSISQNSFNSMSSGQQQPLVTRAIGLGFAVITAITFIPGMFTASEQSALEYAIRTNGRDFSDITFSRLEGAPPEYIALGELGEPYIGVNDSFFSLSVDEQAMILNEELNHTLQSPPTNGGLGGDDIPWLEDDARK